MSIQCGAVDRAKFNLTCAAFALWSSLSLSTAFAADTPLPEDRRALLEKVLRRELAKALTTFEPKGEEKKAEKIAFVAVGYKVEASAKFIDPDRNLELKVLSLAARDEKTLVGSVASSSKAVGKLKGTVKPVDVTIDFDATASIERVDFVIVWDVEKDTGALVYFPKATELKTVVKDVKIHGDLAKVFGEINDLAEKAAKTWLDQNNEKFKSEINKALDRAFRDGKLRISPKELLKAAPAGQKEEK